MATQAEIERLYQETLGRPVDPQGLAFYMASGKSPADIKADLAYSPEGQQVINNAYQQVLGRPADPEGLATYTKLLSTEKQNSQDYGGSEFLYLQKELAVSPEALSLPGADEKTKELAAIYKTYLNRPLDASGAAFFEKQMSTPEGRQEVENYVKNSAEVNLGKQLGRAPTQQETEAYMTQLELARRNSGGFFKSIAPLAGLALMATGAGSALGASLLGAGASATAAGALGGGLIGGGLAAATGGNVLKGAAIGALGGGVQGAYTSGALQSTFSDITGLPLEQVNSIVGSGAGNTGAYVNQVFDDGSVLVTNSAGQIVGGVDAAGQGFGGITAQVFDDGSRLLTGANGQVVGGVDTSGSFFNGQNSISTAGTTNVQTGGAGQYAGSGASLSGTPTTNFGGGLATTAQAGALTGAGAGTAGAAGAGSLLNPSTAGLIAGGLLGAATGIGAAAADRAALGRYASELKSAAATAAPQMQFQPVGITTRFGSTTTPQYDANGRLIGYGYTPATDIAAQRDRLLSLSNEALPTTTNLTQATQDYYNQLQALQRPADEQTLAATQARLQATGRTGLGLGATTGAGGSTALAATNPELAAYYNALSQRQAQQALTAEQYTQQRLNNQIATSGNLFTQAGNLETAAQQPLTLATNLGGLTTTGSTNAARATLAAAGQAADLQAQGALGVNRAITSGVSGLTPYLGNIIGNTASGLFGSLV